MLVPHVGAYSFLGEQLIGTVPGLSISSLVRLAGASWDLMELQGFKCDCPVY